MVLADHVPTLATRQIPKDDWTLIIRPGTTQTNAEAKIKWGPAQSVKRGAGWATEGLVAEVGTEAPVSEEFVGLKFPMQVLTRTRFADAAIQIDWDPALGDARPIGTVSKTPVVFSYNPNHVIRADPAGHSANPPIPGLEELALPYGAPQSIVLTFHSPAREVLLTAAQWVFGALVLGWIVDFSRTWLIPRVAVTGDESPTDLD